MKVYIGPYKNFFGPYQLAELLCFWVKKEKDEYGFPRTRKAVHDFGEFLAHGTIEEDEWERDIGNPTIKKILMKLGILKVVPFDDSVRKLFPGIAERKTTLLYQFLMFIDELFPERIVKVKIDGYDTWNAYTTLALIILPVLKKFKESGLIGYPGSMPALLYGSDYGWQHCFEFYKEDSGLVSEKAEQEWNEILDKMIWSFEQLNTDWEHQYHSGHIEYVSIPVKKDGSAVTEASTKPDYYQMGKGPNDTSKYDAKGAERHQDRIQEGLDLFAKYYQNLWD